VFLCQKIHRLQPVSRIPAHFSSGRANCQSTPSANIVARRVKVYLDTKRVAGCNEIDAVELVGRDGSRQWTKSASASSSYGASTGLSLGDGAVFFNWGRQQHPTPVEDALIFGGAVSR